MRCFNGAESCFTLPIYNELRIKPQRVVRYIALYNRRFSENIKPCSGTNPDIIACSDCINRYGVHRLIQAPGATLYGSHASVSVCLLFFPDSRGFFLFVFFGGCLIHPCQFLIGLLNFISRNDNAAFRSIAKDRCLACVWRRVFVDWLSGL